MRRTSLLVAALVAAAGLTACRGLETVDNPPPNVAYVKVIVYGAHGQDMTGTRVSMDIDAVDQFGNHGQWVDEQHPVPQPYPKIGTVGHTPYQHTIYFEPGLELLVSVHASATLGTHDRLACQIRTYREGVGEGSPRSVGVFPPSAQAVAGGVLSYPPDRQPVHVSCAGVVT